MKKSLLFASACLFLFSLTASAQITKGSLLLGGGISGSSGKSEENSGESKNSGFSISPAVGIAVKENVVVGLRLSLGKSTHKYRNGNYQNDQKTQIFGAGVFYRCYASLSQKFFLFGEGAAYYGRNKQETVLLNSKAEQTNNSVGVNFYPGIAYAVSKKMHLEVGLNNLLDLSYTTSNAENNSSGSPSPSKSRGFNFSTNVSTAAPLTVGFRFVLGK